MKILTAFCLLFCHSILNLVAQQTPNAEYLSYIEKYQTLAIREMKLYKIPASITLVQGLIESGCGKSVLAIESNNHFGIKCHKEWTGEKYYYDDDADNECFRKYDNVDESYRDHSLFLVSRSRYASLFTLSMNDYKGWAKGLKLAGYATNPEYSNILIRNIELYQLYQLDDTLLRKTDLAENAKKEVEIVKPKPKEKQAERKILQKGERVLFQDGYKMPDAEGFEFLYTSETGRKVHQNNKVPFIFATKDDTWFTIAKEFNIYSFQVYKQNDLLQNDAIAPGQMLYLEPKKRKCETASYKLKQSDSMYSVAQLFGVKLKLLYKYNKLKPGEEPQAGFVVKLRR